MKKLFVALLVLAAGLFSFSANAQNTVPATQVDLHRCSLNSTFNESNPLVKNYAECDAWILANAPWAGFSQLEVYEDWWHRFSHAYFKSWRYWGWDGSKYTWRYGANGYMSVASYGTGYECPGSHTIDNGDGTCSIDTGHADYCLSLMGDAPFGAQSNATEACLTWDVGNPNSYSCQYVPAGGVSIDLPNASGDERYYQDYIASGEVCSSSDSQGSPADFATGDSQVPNEFNDNNTPTPNPLPESGDSGGANGDGTGAVTVADLNKAANHIASSTGASIDKQTDQLGNAITNSIKGLAAANERAAAGIQSAVRSGAGGGSGGSGNVVGAVNGLASELKGDKDGDGQSDVDTSGSWWESEYPDGIEGIWNGFRASIDDTALMGFLDSFRFSGGGGFAFSWQLCVPYFDCHSLSIPSWVIAFIRAMLLVTATLFARRMIFGG